MCWHLAIACRHIEARTFHGTKSFGGVSWLAGRSIGMARAPKLSLSTTSEGEDISIRRTEFILFPACEVEAPSPA